MKKKMKHFLCFLIALSIIGLVVFYVINRNIQSKITDDLPKITEEPPISEQTPSEKEPVQSNPELTPKAEPESKPEIGNNNLTTPLDKFEERIWINGFGTQPSEAKIDPQYSDLICPKGKLYPGYHTGVDAEVDKAETNLPVPIRSITDGIVLQAGFVNGYGGLIVIEHTINGATYTAYYGHVDQSTFKVQANSTVKNGQIIANLAPSCTNGNGNTRKHLHFGVHKGKEIVVAGYVSNKSQLGNWIDPRSLF